jgi:hypothetical protein
LIFIVSMAAVREQYIFLSVVAMPSNVPLQEIYKSHILFETVFYVSQVKVLAVLPNFEITSDNF